mmetsp:Transcript_20645/g.47172  ORF Transcript_20645/g.47172 Transcript_20645/m.47172 type:complete len:245 (-) Transcript_20645:940-1674(-)
MVRRWEAYRWEASVAVECMSAVEEWAWVAATSMVVPSTLAESMQAGSMLVAEGWWLALVAQWTLASGSSLQESVAEVAAAMLAWAASAAVRRWTLDLEWHQEQVLAAWVALMLPAAAQAAPAASLQAQWSPALAGPSLEMGVVTMQLRLRTTTWARAPARMSKRCRPRSMAGSSGHAVSLCCVYCFCCPSSGSCSRRWVVALSPFPWILWCLSRPPCHRHRRHHRRHRHQSRLARAPSGVTPTS